MEGVVDGCMANLLVLMSNQCLDIVVIVWKDHWVLAVVCSCLSIFQPATSSQDQLVIKEGIDTCQP